MLEKIESVTDLQHVRLRPAMYFGDCASPTITNCLAREAYCLAIDQIVAGTCTVLTTEFTPDGFAVVAHNGAPLGVEPESRFGGLSEMQAVAQRMAFCAERAASDYVHSNICKHGMAALNAVSERFELHTLRDGIRYLLAYEAGECVAQTQHEGTMERVVLIRFKPDATIFQHTDFDVPSLQRWFSTLPLDTSGVDVRWRDQRVR